MQNQEHTPGGANQCYICAVSGPRLFNPPLVDCVSVKILPLCVSNIALTGATGNLVRGQTREFTAVVSPSNATLTTVTWASSKGDVIPTPTWTQSPGSPVSVATITARCPGTATITVSSLDTGNSYPTCDGKSATVTITVPNITVSTPTRNPASTAQVTPGATLSISTTIANAANTGVTWAVSGGALSSATSYPNTSWTLPTTPGTYTINATSNDSKNCTTVTSANLSVTVRQWNCGENGTAPCGTYPNCRNCTCAQDGGGNNRGTWGACRACDCRDNGCPSGYTCQNQGLYWDCVYVDPCAGINCGSNGYCSGGYCYCNNGANDWPTCTPSGGGGTPCNPPCGTYETCSNGSCVCTYGTCAAGTPNAGSCKTSSTDACGVPPSPDPCGTGANASKPCGAGTTQNPCRECNCNDGGTYACTPPQTCVNGVCTDPPAQCTPCDDGYRPTNYPTCTCYNHCADWQMVEGETPLGGSVGWYWACGRCYTIGSYDSAECKCWYGASPGPGGASGGSWDC